MKPARLALPAAGLLAGVLAWGLFTSPALQGGGIITSFSPLRAFPELWELLLRPRTWAHVAASLQRIAVGLGIAFVIGVPAGVAIGSWSWLDRSASALVQFVRMISPLSWMPIAVMILGVGDAPVYFLVAVASVWPLMLNTAAGVKACDPRWLEMGRSLGGSGREVLRFITIPAISGHLVTGLRLALGAAWIVLVPAEMLGVRSGLGYAVLDARDRLAYPELMAVVLLIGFIGWAMDALVRAAESRWAAGGFRRPLTARRTARSGGPAPREA